MRRVVVALIAALLVAGCATTGSFVASSVTPTVIVDDGFTIFDFFVPNEYAGWVVDECVLRVALEHDCISDLTLSVIAPGGTECVVMHSDDYADWAWNSCYDMTSFFAGGDAAGGWAVVVHDNWSDDIGVVRFVSLDIKVRKPSWLAPEMHGSVQTQPDPVRLLFLDAGRKRR